MAKSSSKEPFDPVDDGIFHPPRSSVDHPRTLVKGIGKLLEGLSTSRETHRRLRNKFRIRRRFVPWDHNRNPNDHPALRRQGYIDRATTAVVALLQVMSFWDTNMLNFASLEKQRWFMKIMFYASSTLSQGSTPLCNFLKAISGELRYRLVASSYKEEGCNERPVFNPGLPFTDNLGYMQLDKLFANSNIGDLLPSGTVSQDHREFLQWQEHAEAQGHLFALHSIASVGRAGSLKSKHEAADALLQWAERVSKPPIELEDIVVEQFSEIATARGVSACAAFPVGSVNLKFSGSSSYEFVRSVGGKSTNITAFRAWCLARSGDCLPGDITEDLVDLWGRRVFPNGLPEFWQELPVWSLLYGDNDPLSPADLADLSDLGEDNLPKFPALTKVKCGDLYAFWATNNMDQCFEFIDRDGQVLEPPYGHWPLWRPSALPLLRQRCDIPSRLFDVCERGGKVRVANTIPCDLNILLGIMGQWKRRFVETSFEYDSNPDPWRSFNAANSWMERTPDGQRAMRSLAGNPSEDEVTNDNKDPWLILSVDLTAASDNLHPVLLKAQVSGFGTSIPTNHWYNRVYGPLCLGRRVHDHPIEEDGPKFIQLRGTCLGDGTSFVEMSEYFLTISNMADAISGQPSWVRDTGDDLLRIAPRSNQIAFRSLLRAVGSIESASKSYLSRTSGIYLEVPFRVTLEGKLKKIDSLKAKQLTPVGTSCHKGADPLVSQLCSLEYSYRYAVADSMNSITSRLGELGDLIRPDLRRMDGRYPVYLPTNAGGLCPCTNLTWPQKIFLMGHAARALALAAGADGEGNSSIPIHWSCVHLTQDSAANEFASLVGEENFERFLFVYGLTDWPTVIAFLQKEGVDTTAFEALESNRDRYVYVVRHFNKWLLPARTLFKRASMTRFVSGRLNGGYTPEEPIVLTMRGYRERWKKIFSHFSSYVDDHRKKCPDPLESCRQVLAVFPTEETFVNMVRGSGVPMYFRRCEEVDNSVRGCTTSVSLPDPVAAIEPYGKTKFSYPKKRRLEECPEDTPNQSEARVFGPSSASIPKRKVRRVVEDLGPELRLDTVIRGSSPSLDRGRVAGPSKPSRDEERHHHGRHTDGVERGRKRARPGSAGSEEPRTKKRKPEGITRYMALPVSTGEPEVSDLAPKNLLESFNAVASPKGDAAPAEPKTGSVEEKSTTPQGEK